MKSETLRDQLEVIGELEARIAESGGEIRDEDFDLLVRSETALNDKVDRYGTYLDRLALAASFYKERAQNLQKLAKGIIAHKDRLKAYVKEVMLKEGKAELQGDDVRFTMRKSKPALEIFDEKALPKEFLMEVREFVPDKERIRAALEQGTDVAGARLREVYALSQKVRKYE